MESKSLIEHLVTEEKSESQILSAFVVDVSDGVLVSELNGVQFECDVLQTSPAMLAYVPGDKVLIYQDSSNRAVVLGRVANSSGSTPAERENEVPDSLLIEARSNLTLKCGQGSITIRNDGKVLIKGKDLVSRAQQSNRIKGGSVSIN